VYPVLKHGAIDSVRAADAGEPTDIGQ